MTVQNGSYAILGKVFALSLLMGYLNVSVSHAAGCLSDTRSSRIADKVSKVANYLCDVSGARVRVEFYTLNRTAAELLESEKRPFDYKSVLPTARYVRNAVYDAFFEKTGNKTSQNEAAEEEEPYYGDAFSVSTGVVGGASTHAGEHLGNEGVQGKEYPEVDAVKTIRDTLRWPKGYKFSYNVGSEPQELNDDDLEQAVFYQTALWRFATRKDIKSYRSNLRRFSKLVGYGGRSEGGDPYFQKLKKITVSYLPKDYALIVSPESCGFGEFSVFPRIENLDVAVLTNLSQDAVKIDRLLGRSLKGKKLRVLKETSHASSGQSRPIGNNIEIPPGGSVAVPLRIIHEPPDIYDDLSVNQGAKAFYESIRRQPSDRVFQIDYFFANYEAKGPIKKRASSFEPPEAPKMHTYVYGPEINLSGFAIGGQRVLFEGGTSNFLALTASFEGGSCPYLYSWNTATGKWTPHGKIIHEARGQVREMTERIALPELRTRFRLREEELERAAIDQMALELTLRNGKVVEVPASIESLSRRDRRYLEIYAWQSVVVDFALPASIDKASVAKAALRVTGYYDRYSALLLGRSSAANPPVRLTSTERKFQ